MKKIYFLLFVTWSLLHAQVTLQVTDIPNNTPEDALIYVAGSFNDWNPGDANFQLVLEGDNYSVTIPEGSGTAEYKFTRGDWSSVEGDENGNYRPNRTFTFTGEAQTITHSILSWEDLGGTATSTAAENVSILAEDFYMPQLDRTRKIWLYLPPDYQTSTKNYPVLYMQDGQNLFDNLTAFAGEWEIDETLNSLFDQGDYGAIVIGIENGQNHRIDEYSPYNNPAYGGGEGEAYVQFITQTLKPFVDNNYRTLPQAEYTAIIGSSLGGLISTYAGVSAADTFDKIGAFSPSYWFVETQLNDFINNTTNDIGNMRIYFVGSENESPTLETEIETVKNNLQNQGLSNDNTFVKIDTYGGHNEAYWRGEFAAAYQWLFAEENLSTNALPSNPEIKLHLLTFGIQVYGLEQPQQIQLYNPNGQLIQNMKITNGINRFSHVLKPGVYFIKGEKINTKLICK